MWGAQPFNCLILSLLRSQTLIPTHFLGTPSTLYVDLLTDVNLEVVDNVPSLSHCCLSSLSQGSRCPFVPEAPRHVEDSLLSHLIRISAGLTYLGKNKFHHRSVMPICLPTSKNFRDNKRQVFAVGVGANWSGYLGKKEGIAKNCFTDSSGPEVLQQCA